MSQKAQRACRHARGCILLFAGGGTCFGAALPETTRSGLSESLGDYARRTQIRCCRFEKVGVDGLKLTCLRSEVEEEMPSVGVTQV